ncbi:MAG: ABC transporter [Rhodospirillaceae bacterium]|nr:ABC transporter [Rhodospirillaceae bacterium]
MQTKPAPETPLLNAKGITKCFGDFTANEDISLALKKGEIHALLGENGAGKSTFVKIIYGLVQPDKGEIDWRGEPVKIRSPQHARELGIGMVFQHFSLFQALTVAENIALALPRGEKLSDISRRVRQISAEYGIGVDPDARIHNLSVGQQQRVEIVRCLLQDPSLLIMDEPTSVLTPQETIQLFDVLRRFSEAGVAILFISHKLDEIRALTERATVLRQGRTVGTVLSDSKSSKQLAEMMVGSSVGDIDRQERPRDTSDAMFSVRGLNQPAETAFATSLKDITFDAYAGEVLGIAGIAGNGQYELMETLAGERQVRGSGQIYVNKIDVSRLGPSSRRQAGLGFVPEERNGHAAVTSMTLAENSLLTSHSLGTTVTKGVIERKLINQMAKKIVADFDVRTPSANPIASALSGGNLQKFVVGREISKKPSVFIVSQPTWGVDVGAALFIRKAMLDLASCGSSVVMISQDLDEIFAISHRVAVLSNGSLTEPMITADVTPESIGLLMGGSKSLPAMV